MEENGVEGECKAGLGWPGAFEGRAVGREGSAAVKATEGRGFASEAF